MSNSISDAIEWTHYPPEELRRRIWRTMLELGVRPELKGFHYLSRAVGIVYDDPGAIRDVIRGLYHRIADEFGTTTICVERDNRTALSDVWSSTDNKKLDEFFECGNHLERRCPASREFIALFADKLRYNMIDGEAAPV